MCHKLFRKERIMEELMKELGVSSLEELKEYVLSPEHEEEEIVKQIKEAFKEFFKDTK